ncbi:hypothetical protein Nepgr_015127 [Nepenthes gracilis]|uniref:O-fucosyltransferase family protein n=1 Tax=Nepenthes gracilis TaxID=150966 RepID=A0AAD3SN33_NEPGR|nr:hypothetical protein Nepgr_015127 [Nepenthes gracilis]
MARVSGPWRCVVAFVRGRSQLLAENSTIGDLPLSLKPSSQDEKYSTVDLIRYNALNVFSDDLSFRQGAGYRKLWGNVKPLQSLLPYSNPRVTYPGPSEQSNGFIFAKIFGGFERIRTLISDLVAVSRLLNATLVIPEIQESSHSKGISSKYTSFSYLYNEDQFIAALKNEVIVVKSLPSKLKEARKKKQLPIFKPTRSASPSYYTGELLPVLKKTKVIGLVLSDGGCLQNILPPSLVEYQRLRCRVAFHALRFRTEILALGHQIVQRLRVSGQPYLAYHPGLVKDTLAYHGCAELFQDVHTELIQYRRAQLIKQHIIKEGLSVDSHDRKTSGSCPLMPEEVGLILRAMGYPPATRIYLAGSETFGGQRVLIPLRALYTNSVDRTSLCSKQELFNLVGKENPIPDDPVQPPPTKSMQQLKEEWDKAGPRPRPIPPPPDRPFYHHEKEGWYGWVAEKDAEPDPSLVDLRRQAHSLLWTALDYVVSVEADAFIPGFHNDGSGLPDFSSLIMGHRLYEMASLRTYRPNRKYLARLLMNITYHLYHPNHNWTLSVRDHLNKSLGVEGLSRELHMSKQTSFLSHPLPECSCLTADSADSIRSLYGFDECPKWMDRGVSMQETIADLNKTQDDEPESDEQLESDEVQAADAGPSFEQDEEMDPDD